MIILPFSRLMALLLLACVGDKYLLRLSQDSTLLTPRVFQIISISPEGVILRISPDGGDMIVRRWSKKTAQPFLRRATGYVGISS